MPNTIEITVTMRGFEVTMGGRVTRFRNVEEAVDFTQEKLRWAQEFREKSRRCE